MASTGVISEICEQLALLLREKRYGPFVRLLNESLQQLGPSADLCRYGADYARATGKQAELCRFLLQWAACAPNDPSPCWQLADLLASSGKVANAVEALDLAEKAGADPVAIAIRRIQILLVGGQYAQATESAMRAMAELQVAVPVAHLLKGFAVLASNLAAAQGRAELQSLVRSVEKRLFALQADAAGLLLAVDQGTKRLRSVNRETSLVEKVTNQIRSCSCGCVIGSADLLDLARPAASVHDGSFWGSRSRVYVVECDEDLLALALATFDVRDVLSDEAVTWVWGPMALAQLEQLLVEREEEPPLNVTASSNPQVPPIVDKVAQGLYRRMESFLQQSTAYYAGLPCEHWRDILGDSPFRPPRVMLITTQFSSYMKFAIRDLATTFERMGWEVRVAIESQPTQRLSGITVPKMIATFHPDLIWQINYPRSTWQGAVPDGVPFVCWDQDSMPHLLNRQRTAQMGRFDFLACFGSGIGHTHWYGYAPDRLIPLSMCVDRSIFRPEPSQPDVDVSYVSHHGWTLDERLDKVMADCGPEHRQLLLPVLRDYAARLDELFLRNADPLNKERSGQVLIEALQRNGVQMAKASFEMLRDHAHHLVANCLWRQQAVRFAAACGASLALFGFGWDKNPEFQQHARGVVEHGQPLAQVFRSSRIALQAVLAGNEHQRLWEAAACGVPVVMRYHPADESFAVIRGWLDQLEKGLGRRLDEVIVLSDNASTAERYSWRAIRVLTAEDGLLSDQVLQYVRRMAATPCVRDKLGEIYDELTFRTSEQLRHRLDELLHDQAARARVCENLQEAIKYHDYGVQIPRVIREIRQRLLA